MLKKHTNNKIINIKLEEEKFYFPNEIIKGKRLKINGFSVIR